MKAEELLNLTLREILEKYCVAFSPECCYTYGITTQKTFEKLSEKYDLSEQESLSCEPFVDFNTICEIEENEEILTFERMCEIIDNNLPIEEKRKNKSNEENI